MAVCGSTSNALFFKSTRVLNPNGISFGSDRQTDRQLTRSSVTVGRIAMRIIIITTSRQSNLKTGRIAAAHGRFNGFHHPA